MEVTAQLQSTVQAGFSGSDQCEYERLLLSRGCAVNAMNINPPVHRSGLLSLGSPKEKVRPSCHEGGSSSSSRQDSHEDASQERAVGSGAGGAAKVKGAFNTPRRTGEAHSSGSALDDRLAQTRARPRYRRKKPSNLQTGMPRKPGQPT